MKTYFRLFSYAKPIEKFAIPYFITTILSVIFRLMTFTMLIPIMQVLFVEDPKKSVKVVSALPDFHFGTDYFIDTFYYYFNLILNSPDGKLHILYFVCGVFLISMLLSNFFNYLSQ